jgi:C-terminal processing protease CtpA/Prc
MRLALMAIAFLTLAGTECRAQERLAHGLGFTGRIDASCLRNQPPCTALKVDQVFVWGVVCDSLAWKSGIRNGDRVIMVNGRVAAGMSTGEYEQVLFMLQTERTLELVLDGGTRNPQCFTVTLTMEKLVPRFNC